MKTDERKPQYWWQYLSAPEVIKRAKKCDIAILPLGSLEQHAAHLPIGHDTIQLFSMCEAMAERTGAMLLPSPWYGTHPYSQFGTPGTIPLENDTGRAVIKDIVHGAAVAGYNKFFLFFGHANAVACAYAVQELGREGYFVASVWFENLIRDKNFDIMEEPFSHASEAETSIGLALFPEFVDMSKAVKGEWTTLVDNRFYQGCSDPPGTPQNKPCLWDGITFIPPEQKDPLFLKGGGVWGDATIATAEKGRKYVEILVDRMVEFINHIKERYPAGVKPPVK